MQDHSGKPIQRIDEDSYKEECAKLKYCLEIGKCAYEQELARSKNMQSRSENIIKYSSLFVAIANLVISLVSNGTIGIHANGLVKILYVTLMISIIFSILLALIAQRPVYIEMFPDGCWMLNEMKGHQEQYEYENKRTYDLILRYTSSTRSLRKANDNSLIFVMISYVLYLVSIGLLTWILVITVSI